MATDLEYKREIKRENMRKNRLIDKELIKYHAWERFPGETWKNFKKRMRPIIISTKTGEIVKVYPAWEKMPNESEKNFKKRMTSTKAF